MAVVHMRKALLIITGFILAFVTTELAVRFLLDYPVYPVAMKVRNIRADGGGENIYYPHSGYWNVEGGNNRAIRNNFGLPGADVPRSRQTRYIFVLGSSYVEALQLPPEQIATSIFHQEVSKTRPGFAVLNLGANSHDAADLLVRASFFSYMTEPEAVILVVDSLYPSWLQSKPTLTMQKIQGRFFSFDSTTSFIIQREIRYHSAWINLVANYSIRFIERMLGTPVPPGKLSGQNTGIPPALPAILRLYKEKFGKRFILLSIMDNEALNNELMELCSREGISSAAVPLRTPQNRFDGNGHLNKKGNEELGQSLYRVFIRFYQE